MKTVLVTGGSGFIGSNFIRHYLNAHPEDNIINVDKITYCGNPENVREVEKNPKYTFIQADIINEEMMYLLAKKADLIVHFAAESHVDNSIKEPFIFTQSNVQGTHVLLEAARRTNIKRFLHISTDEVYGSILEGSFTEEDPMNPSSPYSASKCGAELLVKSYAKTYNLPTVIVRCSNAFGPYQYPEKVIPLFVTNLLQNKKVPLYGDGMHVRDWLFVEDFCSAVDFLLHTPNIESEIFNVPGVQSIPNIELTKKILQLCNKDESFIQPVEDRKGHDRRYSVSGEKIFALGWRHSNTFDAALKKTVDWYRTNPAWWEKLLKKKK